MSVTVPGNRERKEAGMARKGLFAREGNEIFVQGVQQEGGAAVRRTSIRRWRAPEIWWCTARDGERRRGIGKFHAIVRSLKEREADETLLVQSGEARGNFGR